MADISRPRQYQPSATKRSAMARVFFEAVQAVTWGLVTNSEAPADSDIFEVSRRTCGQSSGTKLHS
jgi:hypothetical protein